MLEILPLRDRPDAIEQLARWHYGQWGKWNPTNSVQRRIIRFQDHLTPGRVPQTFVATEDGHVLGSASLVTMDLDSHAYLSPWLASVYVDASQRNRGVGAALVRRVAEEARSLRLPTIYLFTPDRAAFYAKLGWEVIEQAQWGDTSVTIMQLRLE